MPLIFSVFSFWVLLHGMVVAKARTQCIARAKQDSKAGVEECYAYPNLYAQFTSHHARSLNCIQRLHQHIFESLPQAIFMSVVAAILCPLRAAAAALIYAVGRYYASNGYAKGDGDTPKHFKYALVPLLSTCNRTACSLLGNESVEPLRRRSGSLYAASETLSSASLE